MSGRGVTRGQVLAIITAAYFDDGAPLSLAEVARRVGATRQAVHQAAGRLVEDGLLEKVGRGYIPCAR